MATARWPSACWPFAIAITPMMLRTSSGSFASKSTVTQAQPVVSKQPRRRSVVFEARLDCGHSAGIVRWSRPEHMYSSPGPRDARGCERDGARRHRRPRQYRPDDGVQPTALAMRTRCQASLRVPEGRPGVVRNAIASVKIAPSRTIEFHVPHSPFEWHAGIYDNAKTPRPFREAAFFGYDM